MYLPFLSRGWIFIVLLSYKGFICEYLLHIWAGTYRCLMIRQFSSFGWDTICKLVPRNCLQDSLLQLLVLTRKKNNLRPTNMVMQHLIFKYKPNSCKCDPKEDTFSAQGPENGQLEGYVSHGRLITDIFRWMGWPQTFLQQICHITLS